MPSKLEMLKDVAQVAIDSGAERVGRITGVVTSAIREITREVGEWASDVFEVIEATKQAPKPKVGAASARKPSRRKS